MAAKFDKDMLKKHHFWLLFVPVLLGLLLAWLGLVFGVDAATDEKDKANRAEKEKIEKAKAQPKETLKLFEARKVELFDLRTKRWEEMWNQQKGVFEWPKSLGDDQIVKVKDKKFGTPITDSSFLDAFRDHYVKDYATLASDSAPMQFAGSWSSVLRHVPSWKRNPESEDVWLAVEDYWIEKEVVTALSNVNKEAAKLKHFPQEKDTLRSRTFYNRVWQLELQLVNKPNGVALQGTIKNLTNRLQPFNATNELLFDVTLSETAEAKPFRFAVEGGALEAGKQEPIKFVEKKHMVLEGNPTGIYKVEQIYDPRTAPVKRLDNLKLDDKAKSARHFQYELQMSAFSEKAPDVVAAASGGSGGGGTGMAGGPPMGSSLGPTAGGPPPGFGAPPPGPGPGGPSGGGANANANVDFTFNGLARRRYISRTDQVRAVPVGLTVVADQSFVQDAITAVANSKLRFQTVQTHLARFRGSITYSAPAGGGDSPAGTPPGGGSSLGPPPGGGSSLGPPPAGGSSLGPPPAGGSSLGPPPAGGSSLGPPPAGGSSLGPPPGSGPGPSGGMPSGGFPGSGVPRSSNEDQVATNLVEVSIYGIATLYEKFEAVKKDDASGGSNTTGTNDGTPVPPAKGDTTPKAPGPMNPTPPKNPE
jgi:hypothetical protein